MDKINPKNSTENLFVLEDLGWFEILPQYIVYMVSMGEFYLSQCVSLPKPEGTCTPDIFGSWTKDFVWSSSCRALTCLLVVSKLKAWNLDCHVGFFTVRRHIWEGSKTYLSFDMVYLIEETNNPQSSQRKESRVTWLLPYPEVLMSVAPYLVI